MGCNSRRSGSGQNIAQCLSTLWDEVKVSIACQGTYCSHGGPCDTACSPEASTAARGGRGPRASAPAPLVSKMDACPSLWHARQQGNSQVIEAPATIASTQFGHLLQGSSSMNPQGAEGASSSVQSQSQNPLSPMAPPDSAQIVYRKVVLLLGAVPEPLQQAGQGLRAWPLASQAQGGVPCGLWPPAAALGGGRPPPAAPQAEHQQGLGQQHLTAAQRAAPANV